MLLSLRPVVLHEVKALLHQRSPIFAIMGLNELVFASLSLILQMWAISLGPVSLVTTLIGTRALFVVLYSTGLALRFQGFLGEQTSAGAIAIKVVSTMFIVAGIATITVR